MDITSTQTPFRFPSLKTDEILECLSEIGIDAYSNELMEPHRHKEKVRVIYHELVHIALNLSKDAFTTTSMSLMNKRQGLPFPEYHDESFTNLRFIKALMKVMRLCGVQDFGLHDLHSPTTKRFKKHLSAVINYLKYKIEKQASLLNEIHDQKDDLIANLLEVKQEQELLMAQLQKVRCDAEDRWNEAKVVDDDCGEVEIEIAKQNKLQTSIRQESQELKKQANVLKDQIATTELSISELGVKERKLKPQIVESPAKLQEEIGELSSQVDQESKYCDNAEQVAKMAMFRVKNVTKAQDDIVEATDFTKQVIESKEKYEKIFEESKGLENDINAQENESANYVKSNTNLEIELHQIDEKTKNFRKQAETKMDATKASLHALNSELLIIERDRRDASSKVEQCDQEVELLEKIIENQKIETDLEIQKIVERFQKFENSILVEICKFNLSLSPQEGFINSNASSVAAPTAVATTEEKIDP